MLLEIKELELWALFVLDVHGTVYCSCLLLFFTLNC